MSLSQQIAQITSEKIQSTLYQIDNSYFQSFDELAKYLESADAIVTNKIEKIDEKIETVFQEFIRTSSVFEINNKKRLKQQELLKIERQRISRELQQHALTLSQFKINPIILLLKTKKYELQKLEQTKTIVQEFSQLIKGDQNDLKKVMPLDQKNFHNSALRIYVFKTLLDVINGPEYEAAKLQINKKYTELKSKIIQNFKQGFWNRDYKQIRNILPYCEEYELMEEINQFYNEQAFKSVNKLVKLNHQQAEGQIDQSASFTLNRMQEQESESEIRNLFFEIQQGFQSVFSYKDQLTGQINPEYIETMVGKYSHIFSRKLISYAFQKIIRQSLENILKSSAASTVKSIKKISTSSTYYLCYLQIFYDECKKLVKTLQSIVTDDRSIHLISTHFQSIFDTYLDSYIHKELNNLDETYERCTEQIMKDITSNAVNGETDYTRQRERILAAGTQRKGGAANTIKKMFQDFMIESKKDMFAGQQGNLQTPINSIPNQLIKKKIQNLQKIFMSYALQNIFATTKRALSRNNKIAKINQVDRNRNEILQVFISNIEEIVQNLISLIAELVPPFEAKGPSLEPQFFQIIPNINLLLQRVQLMYEQYKKQNKYRLAQSIKLEQKKQSLIASCGKSLSKVVGEAIGSVLTAENSLLHQDQNQYYILDNGVPQNTPEICSKVLNFLQRYLKQIQKISLNNYRNNILKSLGIQFVNLLINFYSSIPYTKAGLSRIFMDIAKYKNIIKVFNCQEVQLEFSLLQILIDFYVLKNDPKTIEQHISLINPSNNNYGNVAKNTSNFSTITDIEKIVRNYVQNKMKYELVVEEKKNK